MVEPEHREYLFLYERNCSGDCYIGMKSISVSRKVNTDDQYGRFRKYDKSRRFRWMVDFKTKGTMKYF